MAQISMKVDKGILSRSIKNVMSGLTDEVKEIRNKTPETVAKKILELSKAVVPIYTGTLIKSGRIETKVGRSGDTSIIYDATVQEQREAQEQKFGSSKNARIYITPGQNPEDSYAELVNERTKFLDSAIDLFNKGEPIRILVTKTIDGKPKVFRDKLDIEIPKYGSITRQDVILAKRKSRARVDIYTKEKALNKERQEYIDFYGEELGKKYARKDQSVDRSYLKKRKREYTKKYKKVYGARS